MVNLLPIAMDVQLSHQDSDSDIRLYLGTRTASTIVQPTSVNDDRMEVDESSSLQYPVESRTNHVFDEAVPSSDEIYHAVVRFVDANEAANGHFIPIEAPVISMEDEDDEMIGDVVLSFDSDDDSDSTASWKTVSSRTGEDNENRSDGSPDTGVAPTAAWGSVPSSSLRNSIPLTPQYSSNRPRNRGPMQGFFDNISRRRTDSHSRHGSENSAPSNLPTSSTQIPRSQRRLLKSHAISRTTSPAYPPRFLNETMDDMTRPIKLDVLLNMPLPDQETMEKHAWNPDDRSLNIFVKDDDRLTFHRHPVAQSTDCIRGKVGYSRGFHVWQITWPQRQRGTHAVVGVATKTAILHQAGYTSLIGQNNDSFGWDLIRNKCYHDGRNSAGWSYPTIHDGVFIAPDSFYCILDMDEGYLAFATADKFLGVAFRGLKGKKLYPIVSAVWGHCEVTMKYMGSLEPEPKALLEICRRQIRIQMVQGNVGVDELPLPSTLKRYVDCSACR